jgi:predicted hydrocarbon binding protein
MVNICWGVMDKKTRAKQKKPKRSYSKKIKKQSRARKADQKNIFPTANAICSSDSESADAIYNLGISSGKELYISSGGNVNVLFKKLEALGLRNILYNPLGNTAVITASQDATENHIGANIHLFESGLISGYFSEHTGIRISTIEEECVYNAAQRCRFVSSASASSRYYGSASEALTAALAQELHKKCIHQASASILSETIIRASANGRSLRNMQSFLNAAALRAASLTADRSNASAAVKTLASHFLINASTARSRDGAKVILLNYRENSSKEQFVRLSSAVFASFGKEIYGSRKADVTYTVRNGRYSCSIRLTD